MQSLRTAFLVLGLVSLRVPWVHCVAECHRLVHLDGICPTAEDVHGRDAPDLHGEHDHAAHAQLERAAVAPTTGVASALPELRAAPAAEVPPAAPRARPVLAPFALDAPDPGMLRSPILLL